MTQPHMDEAGDPQEWEDVEVAPRRSASAVLSVRVPGDLASAVAEIAQRNGKTLSETVRDALESLIDGPALEQGGIQATSTPHVSTTVIAYTPMTTQSTLGAQAGSANLKLHPVEDGSVFELLPDLS